MRGLAHLALGLVFAGCGRVNDSPVDSPPVDSPTCVPAPAGLQALWRADGNAKDDTGAHNGTLVPGQYMLSGRHGAAFLFDGPNGTVDGQFQQTQNFGVFAIAMTSGVGGTDVIATASGGPFVVIKQP